MIQLDCCLLPADPLDGESGGAVARFFRQLLPLLQCPADRWFREAAEAGSFGFQVGSEFVQQTMRVVLVDQAGDGRTGDVVECWPAALRGPVCGSTSG